MPAVRNVNEKRPPGAMVSEFHAVWLDVDVCGTESVLVHVIVVPTPTSATLGLKPRAANAAAPTGIDTDDDGPDGVGEGEGAGVGEAVEEPPHAIVNISSIDATYTRNDDITFSKQ